MKSILILAAGVSMASAGLAQTTAMNSNDANMTGYPACSATVTDSCIQLYERGVRNQANLAMNASMNGSTMAVGGPYEPVMANNTAEISEANEMDMAHSGTMNHSNMGVGGPIDQRTGYRPCNPDPSDDSCIQLYERGVTGSGN